MNSFDYYATHVQKLARPRNINLAQLFMGSPCLLHGQGTQVQSTQPETWKLEKLAYEGANEGLLQPEMGELASVSLSIRQLPEMGLVQNANTGSNF
jgi:hypothetical protein